MRGARATAPIRRPGPAACTDRHDIYWKTEADDGRGQPDADAGARREGVMPPALWLQGRPDLTHDYHDPDSNFPATSPSGSSRNYRKAGGDIEIAYFDNAARNTEITHAPIHAFMQKHVK